MKETIKPLSYAGDVKSMKDSLALINPQTRAEIRGTLQWLDYSLEHEQNNQNRSTVIKMIESKKKQLNKKLKTL